MFEDKNFKIQDVRGGGQVSTFTSSSIYLAIWHYCLIYVFYL